MTTRLEHLEFCKKRALEYLDRGDVQNAIASMMSDLSKHDETKGVVSAMAPIGMAAVMNNDIEEARRFIEGFR